MTESSRTLKQRRCEMKKPKQSRFSLLPASGENSGQIPAQSPGRANVPTRQDDSLVQEPGKSSWLSLHKQGLQREPSCPGDPGLGRRGRRTSAGHVSPAPGFNKKAVLIPHKDVRNPCLCA